MFKKKFRKDEIKRLYKSFGHAIDGFISAFKSERNMVIHIEMALIVILFGLIFKISFLEWIICFILFGLVISTELMNTAIEITVDMITDKIDPKAKLCKDTAAASVFVLAIIAAIVGCIIFIPKIINMASCIF